MSLRAWERKAGWNNGEQNANRIERLARHSMTMELRNEAENELTYYRTMKGCAISVGPHKALAGKFDEVNR